jgi:hypothetical protein
MLSTFLIAAMMSASQPASKAVPVPLDQKRIHHAYNEGNFEIVIRDIETFQASHPTYPVSDSIFIAKHLAVVHSANPDTREKGKYYMFRLLELLPSAKLVDMFVSDEIDRIFDKVREEYMTRQKGFGVDDAHALPQRAPVNSGKSEMAEAKPAETKASAAQAGSGRKSNKTVWIASGAVMATVGVAAVYFLANSESEKEDKVYDVP